MRARTLGLSVLCLAPLLLVGAAMSGQPEPDRHGNEAAPASMTVQYLEIVTPLVDETCEALAQAHSVVFSDPIPEFGNARTANLNGGGRLGVRAPMRATEAPVVRPYVLVDDIQAAANAAVKVGAELAIPPMEIPGQGKFSIYILGGIEHGLWQL